MSAQEVDWSKAPEGATHYLAENKKHGWFACWYKYGSNEWLCMSDSNRHRWIADNDDVELFESMLIKRPAPTWNGEGLPPVEAKCRIITADTPWWKYSGLTDGETVTVHHSFKNSKGCDMVVVEACNGACLTVIVECLAPIRTPEQVEAELADQAIKEIAGIICRDCAFDIDDPEVTESAVALYDAGYRKSPERAK